MGTPAYLVYMVVLFDLRINKSTDSLVDLLSEFPEHAQEIALAPANKTSTIRQSLSECCA